MPHKGPVTIRTPRSQALAIGTNPQGFDEGGEMTRQQEAEKRDYQKLPPQVEAGPAGIQGNPLASVSQPAVKSANLPGNPQPFEIVKR